MTDAILQEIALHGGRGDFVLPGKLFHGKNVRYLKLGIFVPTNDYYKTIPCPNGCSDDAFVFPKSDGFIAHCNHAERIEDINIDPDEVVLFMFDETAFESHKTTFPEYKSILANVTRAKAIRGKRHYRTRSSITLDRAATLTGLSKRTIQNLVKDPKNTGFPSLNVKESVLVGWAYLHNRKKSLKHWANMANHPIPISQLPEKMQRELGYGK